MTDTLPDDAGSAVEGVAEKPLPRMPLPRWLSPLAAVCSLALIPWTIYLAFTLPRHTRSAHYDAAWVGFDIAMLLLLGALAWAAWRRRPYTAPLASAAAMMLITDAWFDCVTAPHSAELMQAVASAAVLELPLAALCIWVAVNAERVRMRAFRRLWSRSVAAGAVVDGLVSERG